MRSPAVAGRLALKTNEFICALLSLDYANSFWVPAVRPRAKNRGGDRRLRRVLKWVCAPTDAHARIKTFLLTKKRNTKLKQKPCSFFKSDSARFSSEVELFSSSQCVRWLIESVVDLVYEWSGIGSDVMHSVVTVSALVRRDDLMTMRDH